MTETQTGMRSTRWLWIAAIWFAGGVFDASQNVLIMHKEGRHHPWPPLFLTELALWLPAQSTTTANETNREIRVLVVEIKARAPSGKRARGKGGSRKAKRGGQPR